MLAVFDTGCSWPKDAIKRQYECVRARSTLYRTVDTECDAARRRKHSAHFAESTPAIWKELQALLAKNQVKFSCRERQIQRTRLDPIDRCPFARKRPSNRQHPLIQVKAGDVPLGHPLVCQAGNNPCSASDVENLISCLGPRSIDDILRPLCCNRRYQVSLEKLWRIAVELPMVVICHCENLLRLRHMVAAAANRFGARGSVSIHRTIAVGFARANRNTPAQGGAAGRISAKETSECPLSQQSGRSANRWGLRCSGRNALSRNAAIPAVLCASLSQGELAR